MEIKSKLQLKTKGETANLPTVKQLVATLEWTKAVDLDLMVWGKDKAGKAFGVYTDQLSGDSKTMGDLNAFPFMQLDKDAGVGAQGGDNKEVLKITKLDEVAELKLIALNFTEAKNNNPDASFANYDAKVTVMNEKGEAFEVPLASTEKGSVATIAVIDNSSPIGATIKREDTVTDFRTFVMNTPGADVLAK